MKPPTPLYCPFCGAGKPGTRQAEFLPEHEQAAASPLGPQVPLTLTRPEFIVTKGGPGGDLPPGRYQRYVCGVCRLGLIVGLSLSGCD